MKDISILLSHANQHKMDVDRIFLMETIRNWVCVCECVCVTWTWVARPIYLQCHSGITLLFFSFVVLIKKKNSARTDKTYEEVKRDKNNNSNNDDENKKKKKLKHFSQWIAVFYKFLFLFWCSDVVFGGIHFICISFCSTENSENYVRLRF